MVISGTNGDDTLNGTDGDDQIEGLDGNDFIVGGLGNDTLDGGAGDDSIYGGLGTDRLYGGAGNDILQDQYYYGEGWDLPFYDDEYLGGDGVDIFFGFAKSALTIDLRQQGVGQHTGNGFDVLTGIEHVFSSYYASNDTLIGDDGGNWFFATGGNDNLAGNGGDDLFTLGTGDKTIDGGDGSDTVQIWEIAGTDYNQTPVNLTISLGPDGGSQSTGGVTFTLTGIENLSTWKGNDTLVGDGADNILAGHLGSDVLVGGAGNDILAGDGSFNQYVYGSFVIGLTEVVTGTGGLDTLEGGLGDDRLIGGSGADTAVYANASGSVDVNLLAGTASGADGNDTLVSMDNVVGSSFDDRLTGDNRANRLDGGAGADQMAGNGGNDTYIVDHAGDSVTEASGTGGVDLVQASVAFTLGQFVENLTLTGSASINGTGNDLANILTGNGGTNILRGLGGDDQYVVDSSGDRAVEASADGGVDTVTASVSFIMGAHVENLTLVGAALNATGNALGNVINGNSNANLIDGRGGADTMSGGMGSDTYIVDDIGDVIVETSYVADVNSVKSSISYTLGTYLDNLTLTGTAAIDGKGNEFRNIITGNSAANVIDGGWGNDVMKGGAGNDTYIVDHVDDYIGETSSGGVDTVHSSVSYILGTYVENIFLTGEAAINATGSSRANHLVGNSAANYLDGRAGADIMEGGAGNDTLFVDSTGDVVIENAGEGTDTVRSTISYVLGDNVENLLLQGTAYRATGNALDNVVTGNASNNFIDGGLGADLLRGGLGDDIYAVDNSGDSILENAGAGIDTVRSTISFSLYFAGANVENLTLMGAAAIDAQGNDLDNVLTGNSAANYLTGNYGSDTMIGGRGDDRYAVTDLGDVVIEGADAGIDEVNSTVSFVLGDHVENLVLGGTDAVNGTGNALDNVITGNFAANVLDGGLGADTFSGGGGYDSYIVNSADDVVLAGDGMILSTVSFTMSQGFYGDLTLVGAEAVNGTGSEQDNLIIGNDLANQVVGNAGNDELRGGGGNDLLDGGTGADRMLGGAGDDTYQVDYYGEEVIEGANAGNDTVVASDSFVIGANVETLYLTGTGDFFAGGNDGANLIVGNNGANTIRGAAGNDRLEGGLGDDTLIGGQGFDTLFGGAGADNFVIDAFNSSDLFADFDRVADTVVLSASVFTGLGQGNLAQGAFRAGTAAQDSTDRVIYDQASGKLYFDADGTGSGAKVEIATFTAGTVLGYADFVVVDTGSATTTSAAADVLF